MSLVLANKKIRKENINKDLQDMLPKDLIKFRYLLHPIRLTMTKLLYLEQTMSSTEIKHVLDISWGEYKTHMNSLESKGYVEVLEDFDQDGFLTQIVILTDEGRKEYEEVRLLLKDFVDKNTPMNMLLSRDEELLFGDDLYPPNPR
jgi:DNA-binding MarR family transcriptional regulator